MPAKHRGDERESVMGRPLPCPWGDLFEGRLVIPFERGGRVEQMGAGTTEIAFLKTLRTDAFEL